MKKKDIETLIKKHFFRNTPDVLDKIDFDSIEIKSRVEEKTKSYVFLKRSFASAFILAFFLLTYFIFPFENVSYNEQQLFQTQEATNEFALTALSSLLFLEGLEKDEGFVSLSFNENSNDYKNSMVENDVSFLFPLIDLFYKNDGGFEAVITPSSLDEFEFKMDLNFDTFFSSDNLLSLHFNEISTETSKSKGEISIEGISFYEGKTFTFYGEYTYEEGGYNLEMEFYNKHGDHIYIEYDKEYDNSEIEIEFVFEFYKNNSLIKSIDIEFERNEEETEFSFYIVEGFWEKEYCFEIEHIQNTITIEYEISFQDDDYDEGYLEGIFITTDNGKKIIFSLFRDDYISFEFEINDYQKKETDEVSFFV